ncbi:rabenosyn-5 [Anopheles darlingi]|uniref:Putative fyve finger-containing protein n=1 Tax=Anopheles darlingi TaxID=43151 RepID=A0A2M4CUS7_ANODA|nr:rabenosyn-5 [Anopheles darlingi]XP_049549196.1 rabenosyn-5 [Anopheles darlingi]
MSNSLREPNDDGTSVMRDIQPASQSLSVSASAASVGSSGLFGTMSAYGTADVDGGSEILEGFLCPICKCDLRTPERLTVHVEQEHSEEQDLLKSLREIFSFAKKKILNLDETANELVTKGLDSVGRHPPDSYRPAMASGSNMNPLLSGNQSVGTIRDHLPFFKAVRSPRLERYASETNKLIIRLDKLLDRCPLEPDLKKRHEQSKVPWIDGKLVKLCPSCAKGFGITRRQHHCRVCGSVMCDGCSRYLSFEDARNIVQPNSSSSSSSGTNDVPITVQTANDTGAGAATETTNFRVCEHCLHLLMNRMEMQDSRLDRPPITKFYERLCREREDIEPELPLYQRMLDSLYEGNVVYRLSDASGLREKIGRSAERLDGVSKAVLALPFAPGSREDALRKAIRLACIAYIKERMLSLPPLPVEAEIKRIQQQRRQETARRLEQERLMALEAYERYEQLAGDNAFSAPHNSSSSSSSTASTAEMTNGRFGIISTMDNWSGTLADTVTDNSGADPLIDQINIVKGYIKQARDARRLEEVATLEQNLSELMQEFSRRQRSSSVPVDPAASGANA